MSERIIPLKVSGYHIGITGDGDAGSLSAASVVFQPVFDETWADMVITARFVDAAHDKTIDILQPNDLALTDGVWSIAMPTEASAYEGDAELSFIGVIVEGTTVTKRQTTKPIRLHIYESNAARDGSNTAPIAPTDAQQIHQMSLVAEAWAQGTKDGTPDEDYADKNAKYHAETSESWAKGTRGGVADPERATDNAKYYAETVAQGHADDAAESALDAEDWAVGTRDGVTDPDHAEDNSRHYAENSAASATLSKSYAKGGTGTRTGEDADNAKKYAENASGSANAAAGSAETAEAWATGGSGGTPSSVNNAANYARQAKSWAIGATGIRPGEDTNNAKYYSEQSAGSASLARDWAIGDDEHAGESAKDYAEAAQQAAGDAETAVTAAFEEIVAADFDPDADYAIGDYCLYEGGLIRFTTEKPGDGEDVEPGTYVEITVTDDMKKKYELPQGGIPTAHIADGAITTDKIADGAITTGKIAQHAVTENEIANEAITTSKIMPKEVKTENIDDGAVGSNQLSTAVQTTIAGKANSSTLAASGGAALIGATAPSGLSGDDVQEVLGSVATELAKKYEAGDGGLTSADLANGSVGTNQLANSAVTTEKLDAKAVTTLNIDDLAVVRQKIRDGAVNSDKLASGVVTTEKLAADALEAIYASFATDGAAGVLGFHTALGADAIPTKTALVTQTSGTPTTWTLRRIGKNHFDRDTITFKPGYLINGSGNVVENSSYCYSEQYIPVLPNTAYIFSGIYPPGTTGTGAPVSCYRADKSFIERISSGTGVNPHLVTPADCYYIRFNIPRAKADSVGGGAMIKADFHIMDDVDIQIEVGANASAPAAYTKKDYDIEVSALNTPTAPTETVTTLLGDNVFLLLGQADAAATMDITARLDPTLAYDQLKAAIVAAGS